MNVLQDLRAQREGLLGIGFWALLVYRFGHARLSIRNRMVRAPWTIAYITLNKLAEVACGIVIGSTAVIGRRLCIEHHGGIVIHGNAVIGDDCLIRHGVTIGNTGPDDPLGAPTVGDRVQFGAGAKVLGRIRIGDDVIIGANAVVVRDVPDLAVVVGVPARVVKIRTLPTPAK
jgi:serine O-acetyltransferase